MIEFIITESDPDRSGSVSVSGNQDLAAAIDRNKRENPTLQTTVLPSPEEQNRQKNNSVAQVTVDASKGGNQAVRQANQLMNTNPALKTMVNQGNAEIVANLGRGDKNLAEQARERIQRELRLNEMRNRTVKSFDAEAFKEYIKWREE